jgi:hypothetical protein
MDQNQHSVTDRGSDTEIDRQLAMQAVIAEYNQVRQAILYRVQAQRRCLYFALTVIGAIVSVTIHEKDVAMLIGIPFVLPLVFLIHREQSESIDNLKSYIRYNLEGQAKTLANNEAIMQYERFRDDQEYRESETRKKNVISYHRYQVRFVFWAVPIAALLISSPAIAIDRANPKAVGILFLWLCACAVTMWQVVHYRRICRETAQEQKNY